MSTKRILIVDDEQPIIDLLREALEGDGFHVDSALSATEALVLVRENLYEAAILDFALPDMNGLTLHREIRRMDDELASKCLFISGVDQGEDAMGYYSTDAAGFIPKPFNVWEVTSRIAKMLGSAD